MPMRKHVTIYNSWHNMCHRCYYPKHESYKNYGAKGVVVCEEWKTNYHSFLDWSLANGWKPGLQLDKDIKGTGYLYSPETCLWVTRQQNRNAQKMPMGSQRSDSKLTERKVKNIKLRYAKGGISEAKLAKQYMVAPSHIHHIIKGKAWPHVKI